MQSYDYIILGGGISGLTFGRLLQLHTNKTFLILEKENEPGGLCRSKEINGNHFDIGGGHFLHSKHQSVYNFIFSHVSQENFNKFVRETKIFIHDRFVDYPLEQNLWQLSENDQFRYVYSMIESIGQSNPENFKDWVVQNLGQEIANNYMIPYNEKLWGIDLNEMSLEWLYKIPKVELKDILRSVIYKKANLAVKPSHDYFYYPKHGGFNVIISSIYKHVHNHVHLSEPVVKLTKTNSRLIVNDKYQADKIINTLPWALLKTISHVELSASIKELKHTGLIVSFYKEDRATDNHWVYVPDKTISEHRWFYLKNYALNNHESYVASETNVQRWSKTRDSFDFLNEYAYPVPTRNLSANMNEILSQAAANNIFGLGRWGQWKHHNSDVCVFEAMKLFQKLENIIL